MPSAAAADAITIRIKVVYLPRNLPTSTAGTSTFMPYSELRMVAGIERVKIR